MKLEELEKTAYANDVSIVEMDFSSDAKGLCIGKCIVLNKNIKSSDEKRCILAEELGHYFTTVGDITQNLHFDDRKQERLARAYAFRLLMGLEDLVRAWKAGCSTIGETAEYLGVTEDFAGEAIRYYGEKYGNGVVCGDYKISFIPNLSIDPL